MATMRAQKILRSDLAKFLPTPQLIKQFEAFSDDIVDNLPSAAEEAQETADAALLLSETLQQQTYIIIGPTPALPNSRGLAVDTGLSLLDGGGGAYITLQLAAFLAALAGLSGFGIVAKTASGSELREIEAGSARIEILNGDGATGNPAIDIDEPSLDVGNMGGVLPVLHGGNGVSVYAAFSANNSATSQSIPTGAFTQLTLGTEEYDQGSYFASSAWTPPAGRVVTMCGRCVINSAAIMTMNIAVFKNGVVFKQGDRISLAAPGQGDLIVTCQDAPNGTDVYDLRVSQNSGLAQPTVAQPHLLYFQGAML